MWRMGRLVTNSRRFSSCRTLQGWCVDQLCGQLGFGECILIVEAIKERQIELRLSSIVACFSMGNNVKDMYVLWLMWRFL